MPSFLIPRFLLFYWAPSQARAPFDPYVRTILWPGYDPTQNATTLTMSFEYKQIRTLFVSREVCSLNLLASGFLFIFWGVSAVNSTISKLDSNSLSRVVALCFCFRCLKKSGRGQRSTLPALCSVGALPQCPACTLC